MTMKVTEFSIDAWHAINAVSIRARCGRYAAARYAASHNCTALYRLACQLDAANKWGA